MKIRTIRIRKDHPIEKPTSQGLRRMHVFLVVVTIAAIATLLLMRSSLL